MKSLIILQRINALYNTLKHENWTLRCNWNEIIILSFGAATFFHFLSRNPNSILKKFSKFTLSKRPALHIPKDQVKHSLENGNTIKAKEKCAVTICARLQLRERENRIMLQPPKELNLISLQPLQISIHRWRNTFSFQRFEKRVIVAS